MRSVARVGGDEFVIVQALDADAERARELGERILTLLSRAIRVFPTDGTDPQTLLRCADAALLRAKREGRRRQIFADDAIFSRNR